MTDQQTSADLALRLIGDSYSTYKISAVKRWFKRNPRCHPDLASIPGFWLNMVERPFAKTTTKRIRPCAVQRLANLKSAVTAYLEDHNADPGAFHLNHVGRPIPP